MGLKGENMEKTINTEKCYALHLNLANTKLSVFLHNLAELGDVIIINNVPYIWLDNKVNKNRLLSNIKKMGITEFYAESLEYSKIKNEYTFLSAWFIEHYSVYIKEKEEEASQEKLKKMLKNIAEAELLYEKKIKSTKQAQQSVEEQK